MILQIMGEEGNNFALFGRSVSTVDMDLCVMGWMQPAFPLEEKEGDILFHQSERLCWESWDL